MYKLPFEEWRNKLFEKSSLSALGIPSKIIHNLHNFVEIAHDTEIEEVSTKSELTKAFANSSSSILILSPDSLDGVFVYHQQSHLKKDSRRIISWMNNKMRSERMIVNPKEINDAIKQIDQPKYFVVKNSFTPREAVKRWNSTDKIIDDFVEDFIANFYKTLKKFNAAKVDRLVTKLAKNAWDMTDQEIDHTSSDIKFWKKASKKPSHTVWGGIPQSIIFYTDSQYRSDAGATLEEWFEDYGRDKVMKDFFYYFVSGREQKGRIIPELKNN